MLKVRVIPTLTIKGQRLVKSVRFENHRNIGNSIAAVRVFNARNVDELIFLDIDAGKDGIQGQLLSEVTKECFMPVTLGGGVKSIEDFKTMLECGADKVAINTSALATPELIETASRRFGAQCVVISIDVRKVGDSYEVFCGGGHDATGKDPIAWAKEVEKRGAGEILLTSIDHDGVMDGYDLDLISEVVSAVRIPVIASGGAGQSSHCVLAVRAGVSAIAAASIFQYTQTTPSAIKEALSKAGFPTRA